MSIRILPDMGNRPLPWGLWFAALLNGIVLVLALLFPFLGIDDKPYELWGVLRAEAYLLGYGAPSMGAVFFALRWPKATEFPSTTRRRIAIAVLAAALVMNVVLVVAAHDNRGQDADRIRFITWVFAFFNVRAVYSAWKHRPWKQ